MMEYYTSILDLIGSTPLIKLKRITEGFPAPVYVKLESRNPGGSIKDRIGIAMIEDAEKKGRLPRGGLIIEATSGNTGIGVALAAAVRGYRCLFVTTDKASQERIRYLKALGADVIITTSLAKPTEPEYYVNIAIELSKRIPNSVLLNQYDNPANSDVHYRTTGSEIWHQTQGHITHFVSGIGTGGTITGAGRYLKEQNPNIQVIAADPIGSIIKTYKETGHLTEGQPYLVEGVGQDRIPANLDLNIIDDIELVSDRESFLTARQLARLEGIFCGGSSGMNVAVALRLAQRLPPAACIVTLICDTGERYLTKHHSEDWLQNQGLLLDDHITAGLILERKKSRSPLPALVMTFPTTTTADVLELMYRYQIDLVPVVESNIIVGTAERDLILKKVVCDPTYLQAPVKDLMSLPLTTVDTHTSHEQIREQLSQYKALVVTLYGYPTGIITRRDIIEYINRT